MSNLRVWRTFVVPSVVLAFLIVPRPAHAQVTCPGSDAIVLDCNGNGTDDYCDLAAGTSADANTNGIPDECDTTECLDLWAGFEPVPPFAPGTFIDGIDFDADGNAWLNSFHTWSVLNQGCPSDQGKALKGVAQAPPTNDFVRSEYFHIVDGSLDCGAAVYRMTFDARSEAQLNPRIDWRMSIRDGETNADVMLIHWASTQSNYPGVGLAQGGNGRGRILVANPAGSPALINTGFALVANTCYTLEVVLDNVANTVALSIDGVLRVTTTRLSANAARMDYFVVQQAANGQASGGLNRLALDNFALCTTGGAQAFFDCNGNCVDDAAEMAPDCDGNGTPDECDIADGTAADCNGNAAPDACDLAEGTSHDCTGDGTPDECQTDCNQNGVLDSCDLAAGTSQDCNSTGVPDECELLGPYAADFEGGAGAEWSAPDTDNSVPDPFTRFTGRFGNNAQVLTLDVVTGRSYSLIFDLCLIDSWDGEGGPGFGPDYFNVRIDGALVFHHTFSTYGAPQTYPFPASVGPAQFGWTTDYNDAIYRDIVIPFVAAGASATISFQGQGLQSLRDEAWGIDNVRVFSVGAGDCNSNGVPDECDSDCNSNGVPDECDLPRTVLTDFSTPGGFQLNGSAQLISEAVRLTPASESQLGSVIFPEALPPPLAEFRAEFDFRIGGGSGADGLNFAVMDASVHGPSTLFGEAGPGAGSLSLEFDTWANEDENDNHLDLRFNGVSLGRYDPTFDLNDNQWHHVVVLLERGAYTAVLTPSGGGPETAYDAVAIPGYVPFVTRYGFGARTGGATDEHWIDNVSFTAGTSADCNTNEVPDECDIAAGTSQDCNTNGVPDDCEFPSVDCNANGALDGCDIFAGTSRDCQTNGVPDECDIAFGTSQDCAGDGVPDECQPDCNTNGVADNCDLLFGGSEDCNTNGIPDECEVGAPQVTLYPIGAADLVNMTNDCGGGSLYNCGQQIGFTWTDATVGSVDEVRIELNIGVQCHAAGTPFEISLNGLPAGTFAATGYFCTCSSTPGELVSISVPQEAYQTGGVNTFLVTNAFTCLGLIPRAEFGGAYARVIVNVIGDCNGNSVPDDCDIAEGASQDCNTNGTPDECEFASLDCNGNAVVDGCDIFAGTSGDCQENGVPDECDIAAGTSPDCQLDGIPDECQLGSGVYLVSGHTADYGWDSPGWDSGYLIGNTLDWLWPNYADSGPILLIWDNGAWHDSWRRALNVRGIPFTLKSGGTVTAADFDPDTFAMIVITEYMYDSSLPNMNALVGEMEDYVASGGVLVDMIATDYPRRWSQGVPGPFGTVTNSSAGDNSYVVAVGHGMVAGMSLPYISGSADHHAQIVVAPADSIVLLSAGQAPGGLPTAAWLEFRGGGGGSDCNTNGIPDECDIAAGTAADCNGNVLPDECEQDCNTNGTPDECDLAAGSSLDCNSNGAPDECDLASGQSLDCNTNGTPDECDLAAGTSADCNGNASPDECEFPSLDCNVNGAVDGCDIFAGTSRDCQANGVPDECDIAAGTSQDCRGDGTPDQCQTDCNQNGVEDSCDLAAGTSQDCNTNGAPDECDVGEPSLAWRKAGSISSRYGHAMAYDSARGVTVLFGGYDGSTSGDTWEWDGSTWSLRATTGPSPRYIHAMAYDTARGVVVLFGGCSNTACPDGETWEWDGNAWTLQSTSGPSPRYNHAMAYDSARGMVVLFGGYDGFGPNGETWEWDGNAWTLQSTSGPSPRYVHAMAYDSARGVVVLFGGYDGAHNGETWEWDGSTWTLRSASGPSPRYVHAMAYDSARGVVVLFGGYDGAPDGDTWEWDGNAWTLQSTSGPSPRYNHAMAYDGARGVVVLFGGYDGAPDGETWEWDGGTWTLRSTGGGPSPRNAHAMAYDGARGVVVLFGGCSNTACPDGETWVWDGSTWGLRATTGPSPRYDHAMAYDSARGVVVLFGGCSNTACPDGETWEWNGSTWSLRATTGPSPRYQPAMAYDSARGVVVLFGGCSNTACPDGETWAWDGNAWTLQSTSGPSPRYIHAMAYDSARGLTMLFGGCSNTACPDGETWGWDGSAWTSRSISGPSPRYQHAMAYDSARGLTMLFGGCSNTACPDGETWGWDGSAWTSRSISGPSPRYQPAMAYDSARGVVVLFGGCSNTACPDGETWVFGPASADCNLNGFPDDCDTAAGTSADCNGNEAPDECERDCNANGTPDDCDVAAGTSPDVNSNAIPDECDPDCNSNGVPDDLDIAADQDCNSNGTLDVCDISAGTSTDINGNAIPDDCEPDCNRNDIPDDADIAAGTSPDCQSDGTPDECQLGGGVYMVSGHTADFGWGFGGSGWDSRYLIDNTLDWLWPNYADSGPILLIWDNGAWFDSWRNALNSGGISFTQKSGDTVTAADFDPDTFAMIVITEYMYDSSLPNMNALVPEMEDYVASGGVLVDMIATNFTRRWSQGVPGPFGTVTNSVGGPNSYVVAVGHGMVTGMSLPFITGNDDHHAQIVVAPADSLVLLSAGQGPGGLPTAAWLEYRGGGDSDCNTNGIPDECETSGSTVETYSQTLSLPIPNNQPGGVSTVIHVPDGGVIEDVNVGLQIDHEAQGDLKVTLAHEGVTLVLINRPGSNQGCAPPASTYGYFADHYGLAGNPPTPLVLDDGAGVGIDCYAGSVASGAVGTFNYAGPARPTHALADFNGSDAAGDWTLTVSDHLFYNTGTLNYWSLTITRRGSGDCNQNGTPDDCDISAGTSADADGNGVPDECEPRTAAAMMVQAVSRRTCDLPLSPVRTSEPRQGGATQVRIAFDEPPGAPGQAPVSLEQKTCAAPQYVPYTGPAVASARVVDHELVLTFTPRLENGRSYRINLGASISSVEGQFLELRVLRGDVDGDGLVNATDRSAVVGVWAGPGFSCATDLNDDGFTNLFDRSMVVGAWTGAENCAP